MLISSIQYILQLRAMSYSFLFKYIIIGDQSVGKSCILMQFIDKLFKIDSDPTIGVQFGSKTIKVSEKVIKLQIWDTAGQQAYKSITRSYYRSTVGAILVYDISNRTSFENLSKWVDETHRHATNASIVIMLVGNKTDLSHMRQVSTQEGMQFAEKNGMKFIECSAKTGSNVDSIFENLSKAVLESIESGKVDISCESGGVKIGDFEPLIPREKKRNCC